MPPTAWSGCCVLSTRYSGLSLRAERSLATTARSAPYCTCEQRAVFATAASTHHIEQRCCGGSCWQLCAARCGCAAERGHAHQLVVKLLPCARERQPIVLLAHRLPGCRAARRPDETSAWPGRCCSSRDMVGQCCCILLRLLCCSVHASAGRIMLQQAAPGVTGISAALHATESYSGLAPRCHCAAAASGPCSAWVRRALRGFAVGGKGHSLIASVCVRVRGQR